MLRTTGAGLRVGGALRDDRWRAAGGRPEGAGARSGAVRADLLPAGPIRRGPADGRPDDDAVWRRVSAARTVGRLPIRSLRLARSGDGRLAGLGRGAAGAEHGR